MPSWRAALLFLLSSSAAISSTATARASEDLSKPALDARPTEHHWYGWQSMLIDVPSVTLLYAGTKSHGGGAVLVGLVGIVTGGPIVHGAHERGGAAIASLLMRLALPVVGGAIGASRCTPHDSGDFGCMGTTLDGVVYGALAAIVLDDLVLAREDVSVREKHMKRHRSILPATSFVLSPDGKSATPTFGIAGDF